MSLGTNALHNATNAMSRSFAVAQDAMAISLERIASGKRFTRASQDFSGYLKAVNLDIDIEKYDRVGNNLSELSATLDQAIAAANSVMDDLKGLKDAWTLEESLIDPSPEQLAAADLVAGYQASINASELLTSSDGKLLFDDASNDWAEVTMANGSTLTVDLSGEDLTGVDLVALGAETSSTQTAESIDNMTSYIGKLQQSKVTVDSQIKIATVMRQNTESVLSAITSIDEAEEMTKFVEQDIRSQAAIAMLSQANMAQRNISLLYR